MTARRGAFLAGTLGILTVLSAPVAAQEINIPVLVPVTGILSLEGTSQRNGALLALKHLPPGVTLKSRVIDTGSSAAGAARAFQKAMSGGPVTAVAASIFGPEMLAMMPLALENKVPLITISGTAKITEMGNPYVFRFFPGDNVVKVAHARYAVEVLGKKKAAIVYQTTAYGQSGHRALVANLKKLGAKVVFEEGIGFKVKDMLPVLRKVKQSGADVLLLHLHSGPTALVIKQAAAMGLGLPIVAGSAMHQPSTAALLEPKELENVCAESGSSPISGGSPAMDKWVASYRTAFGTAPDAFALAQYDGLMMVLSAVAKGARSAEDVRKALATTVYKGLAMTYKSDGKGSMAHSAVIVCYDGKSRVPRIVKRYRNVTGVL